MWWTQPRLTVAACSIHALFYAAVVFLVPNVVAQFILVGTSVLVVGLGFRHYSLELAERHASGEMRSAFEHWVWNGRWRRNDDPDLGDLATELDLPGEVDSPGGPDQRDASGGFAGGFADGGRGGASKPGERFREPLGRALSLLESARLRQPASWRALTVGLLLSWSALTAPWPDDVSRAIVGGALIPMVLTSWLGISVDYRAFDGMIRSGAVGRVAFLAPRSLGDLGLYGWGRRSQAPMLVQLPIFLAVAAYALVKAVGLWPHDPAKSMISAALAVYVLAILAAQQFLLQRLPLLRYPGPPEISAFIDHQVRAGRILVVLVPAGAMILVVWSLLANPYVLFATAALAASASIIFAWNPEALAARRSTRDLAAHLHNLQRHWGLGDEPLPEPGEDPTLGPSNDPSPPSEPGPVGLSEAPR